METKEVWTHCRATPDCTGNYAIQMKMAEVPMDQGGGRIFRYRCKTCNKTWHVRV